MQLQRNPTPRLPVLQFLQLRFRKESIASMLPISHLSISEHDRLSLGDASRNGHYKLKRHPGELHRILCEQSICWGGGLPSVRATSFAPRLQTLGHLGLSTFLRLPLGTFKRALVDRRRHRKHV